MRIRTIFNTLPEEGERFTQPSLTVPDQTMSIREILNRYARGLPVGGSRIATFDEDDDLPDIKTLDLTERQELADQYEAEMLSLRSPKAKKPKKDSDAAKPLLEPTAEVPQTQGNTNLD